MLLRPILRPFACVLALLLIPAVQINAQRAPAPVPAPAIELGGVDIGTPVQALQGTVLAVDGDVATLDLGSWQRSVRLPAATRVSPGMRIVAVGSPTDAAIFAADSVYPASPQPVL